MVFYISLTYIFVVTYIFRLEKIGKLLFFAKKEWENTFNDISDAIIVLDSDFNVVRSNKAAGAILKRPVFETITTNWKDHLNVTASQREENQSQSASVMTEPLLSEIFEQDLNRFLEIKSIPRLDKSKHVAGAIHLVRDITNRKQAEEKIRVHLEYLRALRNIDLSITSSLDLQITLNVLLEEVIAQLHVDAVDVLLIESKSSILGHALGKGFRNDTVQRMPLRVGEGYAGQVAFERKPLFIPDLLQKNLANIYTTLVEKEGFKTYFGMPLIAKGRVNGVLEIFHRTHFEPDAEWIDFLEGLTGQAAIAIDNAVMFVDLEHSRDEILIAYDSTIEGWSRALDFRDRDTERHSERVTEMAVKIGRALKISEEELVHMRRGAFLHDIGKIGVPDSILLKAGSFTEEEWKVMKKHPNIAYEILSPIAFLRPALDIPYCHHEKWDGTGYPRGLKGEEIPLAARIFAVADVWDAMCSDRPNRPKWSKEYVKEHINSLSGTHFDPRIVDTFFSLMWE
jgi:HD-GYP domain-containing protein (c-di-GMP phosphodiesterase class II)